ncbi:ATP-binding cassette, subfamily C, CydD [Bifidobacterium bohemicum]|uniref:Cytochrome D ABC-type transporter, ATPase and permease component n=1 Tax=Bifidobacterium bohemicum DSM 22767 TaxID=1437606 RepID=A0A086ZKD8_9BIFI|nr:ABC transporter ATP-binding protein/permease [Bifidobacterium bohemicum]KFI46988.1 cytochrome D ABC-type transporter, ATPase and permease component [Bifidobacterium bohemicum DSM 22767]SCB87061.1 ATP-binding cassette, subfamily C, CydD [Bifidobacterium bohemicum]
MIDKSLFTFDSVRSRLGLLAALAFAQALCVVAQAYGLTLGLVEVWRQHSLSAIVVPLAIFLGAYLVRQLCDVGKARVANRYGERIIAQLRPELQRKVFTLGPSALADRGTGSTVTMLIDGLDQVKDYIEILLPRMMDMTFIPLIVLVFVWTQDWVSGVVLLAMFPLLIFFMVILGMAARDRSNKQYAQFRILNSKFVDSILGLPTLKMLGVADDYEDEIYSVSERFRKRTISVITVAMTSTFALDFFATLGIAIMAVFLGVRLVDGTIDLMPSMFALILAPEYFLPIRQFGENYHATLNGKNALHDAMTFLDTPEPPQDDTLEWDGWNEDSELTISALDFAYPKTKADGDTSVGGGVAMKAVEQQRDDEDGAADASSTPTTNALTDISLRFHGYEKVAIIGRSGAGKSTLANVLAGFDIPQSGRIELDGRRLEHFNVTAWQRHIAYIPQTPYTFSGTIADNIRFYEPDASREAVGRAAHEAGLDSWLSQLPEGLDTLIGEGNRGISGGQAQRIALARVLVDQSREVLLFDEPTAHLDIETEYELKQTLLPLMERHLVVFATHRLHWLADVDQVVVLDQGKVVQAGRPTELIGAGGPLDALINQMGGNQIDGYAQ